ncbi:hypothetical protein EJF18_20805 [Clavispora lusitaniae]|uniref:Uncharacterized protein n=1 Tax=Clavispora lusitaniae TaxID=36911 RepID=A0ACD0WHT4_CLALS|nr:hypothetical protein EJF14_20805 [Clavispora lusitaniae]QFZ32553.1 hypothetical protein EJF16_20805 [Clavispora lusitaniae]QFZ38222.1 hypothetical protein EJF15_20805 [Clavispora lusitaniae]QFZ43905.1 hypothetical protein EJF18_20805 [Clavispora lusitaniae]QFZ49582.1 hypothetical protein EJF17_20805 [Clavispora lusitaniae]
MDSEVDMIWRPKIWVRPDDMKTRPDDKSDRAKDQSMRSLNIHLAMLVERRPKSSLQV